MTRELKLSLIVGFSLVMVVAVLVSDHLSKARQVALAETPAEQTTLASKLTVTEPTSDLLEPVAAPPAPVQFASAAPAQGGALQAALQNPGSSHTVITQGLDGGVTLPPTLSSPSQPMLALDTRPADPLAREAQARGWDVTGGVDLTTLRPPPSAVVPVSLSTGTPGLALGGPQAEIAPAVEPLATSFPPALPAVSAVSTKPSTPDQRYTIAEGDSLYKLAKRFYGNAKLAHKLGAYNKGRLTSSGQLRAGAQLLIPAKEVLTGEAAPAAGAVDAKLVGKPEVQDKPRTYTVKKGDTLGHIAQKTLGSSRRVGELMRLNQIDDEDSIPVGTVLKLPKARS